MANRLECISWALFIVVVLIVDCDGQATSTFTETRIVIETRTVISDYICAKLINITGACLFRRGRLVEEPEILTFDEQVEEYVDKVYANYQQFMSARVVGVEPTALAVMPFHASSAPSPELDVIESSMSESPRARVVSNMLQKRQSNRQPRIYFSEVNAFFYAVASFFGIRPTVTVTQTNVLTFTSTLVTGSSSSFIIMGCTPSPFPYNVCPAKRRKRQNP